MVLDAVLDERQVCRLWAVTEANALGHGGQTIVAKAHGTVTPYPLPGLAESNSPLPASTRSPRRGLSPVGAVNPDVSRADVSADLEVWSSDQPGDPESPLRRTRKSVRQLAAELQRHKVGRKGGRIDRWRNWRIVSKAIGRPRKRPRAHRSAIRTHQCPSSGVPKSAGNRLVDTKKKELVGDFKNVGRGMAPARRPRVGAYL